jgi:hypothetical protein
VCRGPDCESKDKKIMERPVLQMNTHTGLSYQKIDQWKYRVVKDIWVQTSFVGYDIDHTYFTVFSSGLILLKKEYCYDGPSGPTIDTPDTMVPAAPHDVIYQCMRLGLIPLSERIKADKMFYDLMVAEGDRLETKDTAAKKSWRRIRANTWYYNLRWFGESSAKKQTQYDVDTIYEV